MQLVKYNHPGNLNVFFRQFKDDPLPPWAVNVQPEETADEALRNIFKVKK